MVEAALTAQIKVAKADFIAFWNSGRTQVHDSHVQRREHMRAAISAALKVQKGETS